MPWTSGVYTRGYASWVSDANSALPISATKFDLEDNDFAAGLQNCLTIDGLNKPNVAMSWGLGTAQVLALTRGNDGTGFSVARTGGTNNPSIQYTLTDASGITLNLTTAQTLALAIQGTAALSIASTRAVTIPAPASGNPLTVSNVLTVTPSAVQGLGPVAAALVDMTPDKGSFTGTLTGMTAATTGTVNWARQGNLVFMTLLNLSGTSNANTFTMTGIPASIQPVTTGSQGIVPALRDNGIAQIGVCQFGISGGTMQFFINNSATGWTASGTKGTGNGASACFVSYPLY